MGVHFDFTLIESLLELASAILGLDRFFRVHSEELKEHLIRLTVQLFEADLFFRFRRLMPLSSTVRVDRIIFVATVVKVAFVLLSEIVHAPVVESLFLRDSFKVVLRDDLVPAVADCAREFWLILPLY